MSKLQHAWEVNNLTLNEHSTDDYLVVKDSKETKFHFPLTIPTMDFVFIGKKHKVISVNNFIPYIDMTEDAYNELEEINMNAVYRIFEDDTIVKLYYKGKEYGNGSEIAVMAGDATVFIGEDGTVLSDITSTEPVAIVSGLPPGVIGKATIVSDDITTDK